MRWFTDDQVLAILSAPDVSTFVGFRDAVILRTLWETGLRASELVNLGLGDIHPDAVYVAAGKGGRSRWVPISAELHNLLQGYIALRTATRPGKRAALWVSHRGRALRSRRSVWLIVSQHAHAALGTAVGYDRVRRAARQRPWSGHYPHLLRAGMATTLLHHGCPLPAIMQMLGHSALESTACYLGADIEHLRAAITGMPRRLVRVLRGQNGVLLRQIATRYLLFVEDDLIHDIGRSGQPFGGAACESNRQGGPGAGIGAAPVKPCTSEEL